MLRAIIQQAVHGDPVPVQQNREINPRAQQIFFPNMNDMNFQHVNNAQRPVRREVPRNNNPFNNRR